MADSDASDSDGYYRDSEFSDSSDDDDSKQSGGANGDDDVQSTSQTKFKNADNKVDVATQDDDRSMTDSEASGSDGHYGNSEFSDSSDDDDPRQSGGIYGGDEPSPDLFSDQCRVDAVSHSECDDNDDNNDSGSEFRDRSDDGSPDTSHDFCQLDIWGVINKWYGGKTGKQKLKFVLNRLFNLTLLSRALHHNDVCDSIMQTAEHFQDTFHMGFDEALEHAVLKRRFLICDILAVSAKEAESSMDGNEFDSNVVFSDIDSHDREKSDAEPKCELWLHINNQMADKNVSGDARKKIGVDLVLH